MFYDIRMDDKLTKLAVGGPGFNTTVIPLGAGNEKANANWQLPRREWSINFACKVGDERWLALKGFFLAMQGKAHSFRFRDWSDYRDEGVGIIRQSGGKFYLYKRYNEWAVRRITLPLANTIVFSGTDGNPVVNPTTGEVTGIGTSNGVWTGKFDIEVRFDTDKMNSSLDTAGNILWDGVPVIEKIRV